jgi:hypothetical protein
MCLIEWGFYYMKILKISDILGVCAVSFVLCIGVSIIGRKAFNVDSDFLSASATLFAAIVALYLYNDWRDQQRFVLIEKYQELIRESGKSLFLNYSKFHLTVKTVRNQFAFPSNDEDKKTNYQLSKLETGTLMQELLSEMFHAYNLLSEVEQTPDLNYIFRLADSIDEQIISTAVQNYKELCGYSCVKFLNDQLLKN